MFFVAHLFSLWLHSIANFRFFLADVPLLSSPAYISRRHDITQGHTSTRNRMLFWYVTPLSWPHAHV